MSEIGIKIKLLRENARLSQSALATELNISQTTLCNIESGATKAIDFALVDKLCRFFNKGFDFFLDSTSIHHTEINNGGIVGHNYGTINNHFPENIL